MSRATAGATLGAIGGILGHRGYVVQRDRTAGGRLWCDGACVARVVGDLVQVEAVVTGCDPTIELLPAAPREPSAYTTTLKTIAMEVELRILLRRVESERLDTYKRLRLAGYTCPGDGCKEPLCGEHSRPAEAHHAA